MSLQYTFISEGKRWGNTFPWQLTQEGKVENVHSTRIKREFCKPAAKSYSNMTPEKGLEQFRDGNDMWRWWHFEPKTLAVLKMLTVQMCKYPQNLRGTFLFKMKVVAFYVSLMYLY